MNKSLLIMLFAVSAVLAQTPGAPNGPGSTPILNGVAGGAPRGPGSGGGPGSGPQGGTRPGVVVNSPAWNAMVTAAAQDPAQIKTIMAGLSTEQCSVFASAVINAIETLPRDPMTVIADRVASAAKELIGGTPGQARTEVIAIIFSVTQVQYLPAVAENLAPSFSQSANNLNDSNYQDVAKTIISAVADRTATTDNGTARLAIIVSLFQSGGGLTPEQTTTLVTEACPNIQPTTRETVTTVSTQVSTTGSYVGVANLTGVTLAITPTTQQQITQREQAPAQQPAQTPQQGQTQQPTTEQQGQTQQGQTEQGQQPTTTPAAPDNNIGAPALNPAVNTPGTSTDGLLGAIADRGTDSIGTVVTGGTGGGSGNADQGGGQGGGFATGGGDITPPPPPPPPIPPHYQGVS